ncbi:uncharacterized protein PRCAT00002898001 [Priceomyces carsonii]|uniref:uncharacterized protein n=1 Tax=Priceomyces carsonii TaxID=28549 RepID=UPI002EDA3808|nr:unnamed protein product [Priceomyces carsonii]
MKLSRYLHFIITCGFVKEAIGDSTLENEDLTVDENCGVSGHCQPKISSNIFQTIEETDTNAAIADRSILVLPFSSQTHLRSKHTSSIDSHTNSISTYQGQNSSSTSLEVLNVTNSIGDVAVSKSPNATLEEDCHFLSFEEWKKQVKVEASQKQKLDNVTISKNDSTKNQGLISKKKGIVIKEKDENIKENEDHGKIYKDKFNFASVDCAATIVKTNSDAKGASAILFENKDSYLLNECASPNKFVVIELCQDILVDTIVIGNFEFFSSMFERLRFSVSDRFPTNSWNVLGEFKAQNVRDVQTFKIENPLIWARYLKLEILSHYGNEFYCPISIVRVHGKTMMQEFKEGEESTSTLDDQPEELLLDSSLPEITNNNFSNKLMDECRVIMPHLELSEFLKDINSTSYDYCDANITEPEITQIPETKTIQESIYKNIMKRLSLLESNASLSLLYIEEQSKLLSTAFTNLERRQTKSFDSLLLSFNSTITNHLFNFKKSYSILQKEYHRLFKAQESHHRDSLKESNYKLLYLGSELRFQKRVCILNTIIMICLLVYFIVSRDVYIEENLNIPIRRHRAPRYLVGFSKKFKRPRAPVRNGGHRRKKRLH